MHRIEITMIGGHGCDRIATEGQSIDNRCFNTDRCPDCAAAEFVAKFKARGAFGFTGTGATLTHWPGEPSEVVDDLVEGVRKKGHF